MRGAQRKRLISCSLCPAMVWRSSNKKHITCSACKTQRWYRWSAAHPDRRKELNRRASKAYRRREKQANREVLAALPCIGCGGSHLPERRLSILRRMADMTRGEIHDAWPCLWPETDAGERKLERDFAALRGKRAA